MTNGIQYWTVFRKRGGNSLWRMWMTQIAGVHPRLPQHQSPRDGQQNNSQYSVPGLSINSKRLHEPVFRFLHICALVNLLQNHLMNRRSIREQFLNRTLWKYLCFSLCGMTDIHTQIQAVSSKSKISKLKIILSRGVEVSDLVTFFLAVLHMQDKSICGLNLQGANTTDSKKA